MGLAWTAGVRMLGTLWKTLVYFHTFGMEQ